MQYFRTGRRGLAMFRQLIGRPILKEPLLQDVVFASGRGECTDANAAADRASVYKLGDLDANQKKWKDLT